MADVKALRLLACALVVGLSLLAAACGGSGAPATTARTTARPSGPQAAAANQAPTQPFSPVLAMSEVLVGKNRFSLGIIDNATRAPLPDASVRLRFFELKGDQGTLRFEADATFRAPAREAGLATAVQHRHADGSIHTHSNAEADVGVYTAVVSFDKAGPWGVQALIQAQDGRQGEVRTGFEVLASTKTPLPGQPAPRSRQPTVRDVKDLSEIDSSAEPVAALHDMTIADAVSSGRPTLVLFATPGYCVSRICGPSYEIVKKLMPAYAGKVNFIHIEVWKDFNAKQTTQTFQDWNLTSEPWIFIIDRNGIIAERFDGPTTSAELEAALTSVLR